MSDPKEFYTLKGYQAQEAGDMTAAMEDYLEMICRLLKHSAVVRIGELAAKLNVSPPSVSKMITHLNATGYIHAQKYGYIVLTEKGRKAGDYLLYRHAVLQRFLCVLNQSDNELEQVEKIEHFLNKQTIENLNALTKRLETEGKGKGKGKA